MATSDERIGRNVAQLRGAMSQEALAAIMRERGWKWSQSTVWSVERGDRPVRLSEAEDLADIFGLGPMGLVDLTSSKNAAELRQSLHEVASARLSLDEDTFKYLTAQVNLAHAAGDADLSAGEVENVEEWLRSSPEDRVRRARKLRAQLVEANSDPRDPTFSNEFLDLLNAEWARHDEHPEAPER